MAALDVEFGAVSDVEGKFARLAQLLGLADADHARGKVEHLWMACTTRGEPDLPLWLVEKHLGAGGAGALVEAELGSWGAGRGDSDTRRVTIAGAEKRCLWMRRDREQSSKGGKSRAATASRAGGRFTSRRLVESDQPKPAPSPSPSPSPSPEEDLGDAPASPPLPTEPPGPAALTLQPSPAKAPRPAKATKHRLPAGWTPRPQERERARSAGIDPDLEAERFRDHHTARATTFADWDAGFRTWLSKAVQFSGASRAGPPPRDPDPPRKIVTLVR